MYLSDLCHHTVVGLIICHFPKSWCMVSMAYIFSRPTSFLQKSSCRVSSEKNILNSSVEWSRVEWSDVKN